MSIHRKNKEVVDIIIKGKRVSQIFQGIKLIYSYLKSCFGKGFWVNDKPWNNSEAWKNQK